MVPVVCEFYPRQRTLVRLCQPRQFPREEMTEGDLQCMSRRRNDKTTRVAGCEYRTVPDTPVHPCRSEHTADFVEIHEAHGYFFRSFLSCPDAYEVGSSVIAHTYCSAWSTPFVLCGRKASFRAVQLPRLGRRFGKELGTRSIRGGA